MRSCVCALAVILFLGVPANIVTAAESPAIRMMAGILMSLRHSPSYADRQALEKILVDDNATTFPERVVAEALLHVRHIVRPEEKAKLEALITDQSVPASITILATVLVTFTHTVTEADRERLEPLAVDQCVVAVDGMRPVTSRAVTCDARGVDRDVVVGFTRVSSRGRPFGEASATTPRIHGIIRR